MKNAIVAFVLFLTAFCPVLVAQPTKPHLPSCHEIGINVTAHDASFDLNQLHEQGWVTTYRQSESEGFCIADNGEKEYFHRVTYLMTDRISKRHASPETREVSTVMTAKQYYARITNFLLAAGIALSDHEFKRSIAVVNSNASVSAAASAAAASPDNPFSNAHQKP